MASINRYTNRPYSDCTKNNIEIPTILTDSYHDSPPQNQRLSLTNVSWLLDKRKDAMKVCLHTSHPTIGLQQKVPELLT